MKNCLRSGIALTDDAICIGQFPHSSLCTLKGFAHAMPCRAADDVMAVQRRFKRDGSKEVKFEFSAELFQFVQGQIVQLATLVQAIADSVANLLVRFTKGNTLVYKIRRSSHRIQKAALAGSAHALRAELERSRKFRQQLNRDVDSARRGKDRLLRLLHVFVVSQRKSLEQQRNRLCSAVDAAN